MSTDVHTSNSTSGSTAQSVSQRDNECSDRKMNIQCHKCGDIIVIPYIQGTEGSKIYCINCNPSTSEKKYKWNVEEKRWYIDHYTYGCFTCKKEIKSYIRLYDEEDIVVSCNDCDPSTEIDKYKWNEKYECWDLDYRIVKCNLCDKELRVRDIFPKLRVNLNEYHKDLWYESREIIHGYNCLNIRSSSEPEVLYVNEIILQDGFNRIEAYKCI